MKALYKFVARFVLSLGLGRVKRRNRTVIVIEMEPDAHE
jgi:hypothetical protein